MTHTKLKKLSAIVSSEARYDFPLTKFSFFHFVILVKFFPEHIQLINDILGTISREMAWARQAYLGAD